MRRTATFDEIIGRAEGLLRVMQWAHVSETAQPITAETVGARLNLK